MDHASNLDCCPFPQLDPGEGRPEQEFIPEPEDARGRKIRSKTPRRNIQGRNGPGFGGPLGMTNQRRADFARSYS